MAYDDDIVKCVVFWSNFFLAYTTVLFVLFAVQLTVGISSFYQLGDMGVFRGKLNLTLEVVFQNYNYHFENKAVVDLIQHRLKCCGFNGPDYWDVVPKSCHVTDSQDIFEQPCPPLVSDYIDDSMNILGISVIVLSIPEMIGSLVSFFFAFHLKHRAHAREFISIKDYTVDNGLL
nr:tetraspanin-7-like isoform X2 [Leptinotarsa decemlineata]